MPAPRPPPDDAAALPACALFLVAGFLIFALLSHYAADTFTSVVLQKKKKKYLTIVIGIDIIYCLETKEFERYNTTSLPRPNPLIAAWQQQSNI
jgi:hypothetical protein